MKNFIVGLFILLTGAVSAQSQETFVIEENTKSICNQVMMNVFNDIYSNKDQFQDLVNFDRDNLQKNKYGIYTLYYRYDDPDESRHILPYEFGMSILGIDDTYEYQDKNGVIYLAFPLLDLKIAAFQTRTLRTGQYDIKKAIQKYGAALWEHQQEFIPLELTMTSGADTILSNEPVDFTVTLTNNTNLSMKVKDLGADTVSFKINDEYWISDDSSGSGNKRRNNRITLKPGQSITQRFTGASIRYAQDLEILATYDMTFKGINPTSKLKLRVVSP